MHVHTHVRTNGTRSTVPSVACTVRTRAWTAPRHRRWRIPTRQASPLRRGGRGTRVSTAESTTWTRVCDARGGLPRGGGGEAEAGGLEGGAGGGSSAAAGSADDSLTDDCWVTGSRLSGGGVPSGGEVKVHYHSTWYSSTGGRDVLIGESGCIYYYY